MTASQSSTVLSAVQELAPKLEARAEETEQQRGIPADLIQGMRDAGVFRMMIPKKYGGEELDCGQVCKVVETLAAADGSAGWTALVAVSFQKMLPYFPLNVLEKDVLSEGADIMARGGIAPLGKAVKTAGGYLVSGRWPFASGHYAPRWVSAGCLVIEDGKPKIGPAGAPETCAALVPGEQAEFLDTWFTVGMCGTDSRDFVLKETFVPDDYVRNFFAPTTLFAFETPRLRLPFVLPVPTHSAVCIGIAQAAVDEVSALAHTKRAMLAKTLLKDDQIFLHRLGGLAARVNALRAMMYEQCAEMEEVARSGLTPTPLFMGKCSSQTGATHVEAIDIVNECFSLSGSYAVYSKAPLQRRWRDVRVAAQHIGGSLIGYPMYGGALVGSARPEAS